MRKAVSSSAKLSLCALALLGCSRSSVFDSLPVGGAGAFNYVGGSMAGSQQTGGVVSPGGGGVTARSTGGYLVGGDMIAGATSVTGGYVGGAGALWATGGTVAGSTSNGGVPWFLTGGAQATGGVVSSGGNPAVGILNPIGCDTLYPFVLTIEPSGDRGSVSGWLDASPSVVFENQLPRFTAGFTDTGDISTWWSIASWDDSGVGTLYFYSGFYGGLPDSPLEIAVAEGAKDFSDIDRNSLMFVQGETRPLSVGEIAVLYNPDNGLSFAIRADAIYIADPNISGPFEGDCTAIDASWTFTF